MGLMPSQLTKASVATALVADVPEFSAALDEHLDDMGGDVLPHLLFGDLTRFLIAAHERGAAEPVPRTLQFLEGAIRHGDQYVKDLVAVSFIENIGVREPAMAALVLSSHRPCEPRPAHRAVHWTGGTCTMRAPTSRRAGHGGSTQVKR
jgi:hypothetical protein